MPTRLPRSWARSRPRGVAQSECDAGYVSTGVLEALCPPPRYKCCSAWLRDLLVRVWDLLICTYSKGPMGGMSVEAVTAIERRHGPSSCRNLAREADHLLTLLHDQRSDRVLDQNDLSAMALCVWL